MSAGGLGRWLNYWPWNSSRQNLTYDSCGFYAGELLLQALKAVVELVVVEAEEIKHGGMQIADLYWVLDDLVSHVVGRAVRNPGLDSGSG